MSWFIHDTATLEWDKNYLNWDVETGEPYEIYGASSCGQVYIVLHMRDPEHTMMTAGMTLTSPRTESSSVLTFPVSVDPDEAKTNLNTLVHNMNEFTLVTQKRINWYGIRKNIKWKLLALVGLRKTPHAKLGEITTDYLVNRMQRKNFLRQILPPVNPTKKRWQFWRKNQNS